MQPEIEIDQLAERLWIQTLALLQAVREGDDESVRQLVSSRETTIGELELVELSATAQEHLAKTRSKDVEIMMALESQHTLALETLLRSRRESTLSREYGNRPSSVLPGELH